MLDHPIELLPVDAAPQDADFRDIASIFNNLRENIIDVTNELQKEPARAVHVA